MIYFVHCERTGLTKIGFATTEAHAADRLRGFQCSSATRLRIVSLIDGDRAAERAAHQANLDRRVHGEWFREIAAPSTQYDLAQFRTDIGARKAPALVEPGSGLRACACGATIRGPSGRWRGAKRCHACAVAAGTDMASKRSRSRALAVVKHATKAQREGRLAKIRDAATAAGLSVKAVVGRLSHGRTLDEALYPRGNRGRKNVTDHACRAANRCAPSLGMSAQHIYLVLRGKKNHERADEIRAAAKAAGWRAP